MKNVKSFICNTVALLISILFLIFMGQPCVGSVVSAGSLGSSNAWSNGYDCINFSSNDGKVVALAVGLLLATIFACVLILTSIYGILRAFDVVKANKADKIVRWVNIVTGSLFVVFMFLAFIMDICIVAEFNGKTDSSIITQGLKMQIGWGMVINFVLSIVSLVAICFDKGAKKASKSKKK